jgi:hypothetical protein
VAYVDLMSGVMVIVAYRPKPGKEDELLDLVRSRVPILREKVSIQKKSLAKQKGTATQAVALCGRAGLIKKQVLLKS